MSLKLSIKNLFLVLILLFFTNGCAKKEIEIKKIKELDQDLELYTTYKEAYLSLNEGDAYYAAKKFLEAELLYPQSEWAPKSLLMASFSFYLQNYYSEAINNLERYLKTYPNDSNIAYAHYLIAMCYYETIEDEKRDSLPLYNAKQKFNFVMENFPNSDFALDSKFKLDFINDLLASKEMYIGRHYIKKKKWIAALNRFKNILNDYDQTVFIEEALHRLVEINFKLGLLEESQKYANILGYNYQSSEWYKKTYKIFNQNYKISSKKKVKKDRNKVIKKFKKFFE